MIPNKNEAVTETAPAKVKKRPRGKAKSKGWSLYQRPDHPGWCMRYKDPTRPRGKQWAHHRIPPAKATTEREAEVYAAHFVLGPKRDDGTRRDDTLRAYAEDVIARWKRNPKLRKSTVTNKIGHLRNHILPALGHHALNELKGDVLRDFVVAMRDGGKATRRDRNPPKKATSGTVAANTARNVAATLKNLLDRAIDEERMTIMNKMRSAAVREEMPDAITRAKADGVDAVHVRRDAAATLVSCDRVPEDRRARYLVAMLTGLRDGELSAITWADVVLDATRPFVDVSKSLDTKREQNATKTRSSKRKVPLNPLATKVLRAWKAGTWVVLVGRKPKDTDAVFPTAKGKAYRPRSAVMLRRDLKAAELETHDRGHAIDFHALRRSFATWLKDAEVSDRVRKRLMGHRNSDVTDDSYTATEMRELAEAVAKLNLDVRPSQVVNGPFQAVDAAGASDLVAGFGAAPRQASGES